MTIPVEPRPAPLKRAQLTVKPERNRTPLERAKPGPRRRGKTAAQRRRNRALRDLSAVPGTGRRRADRNQANSGGPDTHDSDQRIPATRLAYGVAPAACAACVQDAQDGLLRAPG